MKYWKINEVPDEQKPDYIIQCFREYIEEASKHVVYYPELQDVIDMYNSIIGMLEKQASPHITLCKDCVYEVGCGIRSFMREIKSNGGGNDNEPFCSFASTDDQPD